MNSTTEAVTGARGLGLDLGDVRRQAFDLLDDALVVGGRHHVADFDRDAGLEARDHVIEVGDAVVAVEHGQDGALDQLVQDLLFLAVLDGLELDLAGDRRDDVTAGR